MTVVGADLEVGPYATAHDSCLVAGVMRKPPPRLRSFDYVGFHRYFLTICTIDRSRIFTDQGAVESATAQLVNVAEDEHFSVIAYCFMPDHMHALIEGTDDASDFSRFVRLFKQRSAFHWKRTNGRILWQRSYFEHVLRDNDGVVGVAKYILENPVRAGLVNRPDDYPYLGSLTMTVPELLYSVHW